jgi:pimeloyl-ACP methyl ester carboxylesterase
MGQIAKLIYIWTVALLTISRLGATQQTEFNDDFVDTSPHKSAFITVNGVKLHYLDWGGHGKPLLFLTGLGNSAHIYDDLAPKFVNQFRVLALTRRGHGKSDKPEKSYDIDRLAEDVRQFLDMMTIERVTLIGHSMAGDELTRFAGLFPERVDRLVYLDAAYDHLGESGTWRAKAPDVFARATPTPQDLASIATVRNWLRQVAGVWSKSFEADMREIVLYSPEGKLEFATKFRASANRPPDYTKVKAPALSFYALFTMASAFPWITPDVRQEVRQQAQFLLDTEMIPYQRRQIAQFRKGVANGRVIEMPNTLHYCFIEKQEDVVREMRAFLPAR